MRKITLGTIGATLPLAILALSCPAWAVSLVASGPVQAIPQDRPGTAAPLAIESWSAGSATLVPLMAADTPVDRPPSVDVPADRNASSVGKPLDDVSFFREATENGREEVAAARDALPQLKRPELKHIAEMLVDDHSQATERLTHLAASKGWPIPGPQAAAVAAPPPAGTASGDFDTRWTAQMIDGHERSLALYRGQAQAGEDKDLRNFARETLPIIERHLAELRSVQK